MEIIRTTPYSATRSRPRNNRVTFEKGLTLIGTVKEPLKPATLIVGDENVDLEAITAQLEEAGENLGNDPTLDNFLSFKDSMGKFARKATSIAYCIDKIFTPRQKSHVITRVVDEETDYLYNKTMSNQNFNIRIASEVDDIKGMILNNCI
jgi:uncharacterized protein YaaR (DUF327 family)